MPVFTGVVVIGHAHPVGESTEGPDVGKSVYAIIVGLFTLIVMKCAVDGISVLVAVDVRSIVPVVIINVR